MWGSKGFPPRNVHPQSFVLLFSWILLTVAGCVRPEPPQQEAQQPLPESSVEQARPSPPPLAKLELHLGDMPQRVVLTPDSKLTIEIGETQQLKAVAWDTSQQKLDVATVTWTSRNPEVATVDPQGTVTSVAPGETTITASTNGQSASVQLNVIPPKIAKLEIKAPATTMVTGESLQLELIGLDTKNRAHKNITAQWDSNNVQIAQINNTGLVAAATPGSVMFTATASGKTAVIKMTVVPLPLARLQIRPSTTTMQTGETKQFEAVAIDAKNQERKDLKIFWQTDKPNVASINDKGFLSALRAGSVSVTAKGDGQAASAQVTITAPPPPKVEVRLQEERATTSPTPKAEARLQQEPQKEMKPPVLSKSKEDLQEKYKDVDPSELIYLSGITGELAGKGDSSSVAGEAERAGLAKHPLALEMADLPKDKYGLVDWAAAIKTAKVKPRHSLDPKVREEPPLDLNVVIFTKSKFQPDVIFPHKVHTMWLGCENCHDAIFKRKAGGHPEMTMPKIAAGEYCGRCHNRVAFPLSDCLRCHVKPKNQPPLDPDPHFRPTTVAPAP